MHNSLVTSSIVTKWNLLTPLERLIYQLPSQLYGVDQNPWTTLKTSTFSSTGKECYLKLVPNSPFFGNLNKLRKTIMVQNSNGDCFDLTLAHGVKQRRCKKQTRVLLMVHTFRQNVRQLSLLSLWVAYFSNKIYSHNILYYFAYRKTT